MPPPDTAIAVREEHPIIAKIDAKMPEIAQMLPEGMSADRFRRVVVQALVRNPDLWACTPVSVVSAIVEAAQIGLEPTGVLGRAWLLPYSVKGTKEAKLIVGYRGYAELAWRADRILVTTGAVRAGDHFEYRRGTGKYLHHVPASDDAEREVNDANITDFWAMYTLPDGREDFDVMSRKGTERIRDKARYRNPVWDSDFAEMGRKTVLRRLLKVAPLSPEVQRVLARDEEIDFDTPVERVADPKRSGLRDRIAQRTAAIRGEPIEPGESEASVPTGGAEPSAASDSPDVADGGSPATRRDPWMARLHALGNERGYDHDALHDWAGKTFGTESLTDLTTSQRADFMEMVERLPEVPA
jgi:recombination protein RecT